MDMFKLSFGCQMKIKGFILLIICLVLSTLFYCLVGDQKPLEGIIYDNHFSQSLVKIKNVVVPAVQENRNYYLNSNTQQKSNTELKEKYLKNLGFTNNPRLFPSSFWNNVSLPVFVTAIKNNEIHYAQELIKSMQESYPEASLLTYLLDMDEEETEEVTKFCNSSVSCYVRKFEFQDFPLHVSDLKLFAFRPIIIQQVLNQAGAVLWIDPGYQLTSSTKTKLEKVTDAAKKEGLQCWTIDEPTTAMTHPRMFDYFHTSPENYYFHRMIESSIIVLYNIEKIHTQLMLPWLKCALTTDCIAPIGAQSYGCRFDKRPLYRYSGCHHYDLSALSIILGYMYNYRAEPYSTDGENKFFTMITSDEGDDSKSTKNSLEYTGIDPILRHKARKGKGNLK